ncbi:MAG: polyphosphate kinase 1 [Chloroflexota bacterium]|nr:polyphosphate kinase 1 [Chloroflexota bacterium]
MVALESEQELRRSELYINREIAAIGFIRRVLEEAQSHRHPLLERVKFLSFVSNQMDEFLMVRMAGLQDQLSASVHTHGPDGMTPEDQIRALRPLIRDMLTDQRRVYYDDVLPKLAEAGIQILDYAELTEAQREEAASYFHREVFPVLTPLGVDRSHPFPLISSRSLNLAVTLRDPLAGELFARIKAPPSLRRLAPITPTGRERRRNGHPRAAFVWLEQLIAAHLDQLFPGMEIIAAYPFRVLRDADFEIQADEAGDLLDTVEQGILGRRFGSVVGLLVQTDTPPFVRSLLCEKLEMDADDIYDLRSPLGMSDLAELLDLDRPDLKDRPLLARTPGELRRGGDIFAAIQRGDILLHHPYDSFGSVVEFIQAAARDPHVLAIKQTLYRVGTNSPIVAALLEAVEAGKQVAVMVELKARFDEENNIEWARTLEHAGVHVVYGQIDLKTHAKVALVVRREGGGLRRYVHLGTGNYNASTARVYEDYGLLTCRPDIAEDASHLFNMLTGFARGVTYQKLLVAPTTLRAGVMRRIEREIDRTRAGGQGRLIFKLNAIVDKEFIQALYRASQAGVRVDLLVRGMCCLRPGIAGVSENIHVTSLVGRFLEHSRIYYFANGGAEGEDEVLLGSADLMPRNLDHRVEALFPVEDPALRAQLARFALPAYLRDTANARRLLPDGSYKRIKPAKGDTVFDVQQWFGRQAPELLDERGHEPTRPTPLLPG